MCKQLKGKRWGRRRLRPLRPGGQVEGRTDPLQGKPRGQELDEVPWAEAVAQAEVLDHTQGREQVDAAEQVRHLAALPGADRGDPAPEAVRAGLPGHVPGLE